MNRYKALSLGIVRRWAESGEWLVDQHITLDMVGQGFLVTVAGPTGSGKTTLGWQIAKRLHEKGCRAPAFIDETVFERFIDTPHRFDEDYRPRRPYQRVRDIALRTHTPVVLCVTTSRTTILQTRIVERHILHSHSELMFTSDLVWMTELREREVFARLMKSRTTAVNMVLERCIHPRPDYSIERCPYYLRGIEMARQIENR